MKLKKEIIIILVFCALLSLFTVSASELDNATLAGDDSPNDIYVDVTKGSDINSGLTNSSPLETFSTAVSKSDDNDTIYLSDGTYRGDKNTRITIDKSISIVGSKNTTFDGENENYLFTITGNACVVFKNINFINAYKSPTSYGVNYDESVYGAALEIKNGKVIVDNCMFENNVLNYGTNNNYIYGGAISNFGDLTVANTKFVSNVAESTSGLFSYGGAVYNRAKLFINNSEFIKSFAQDFGYGAAIANDGDLIVDNSVIRDSKSLQECRGSAIYNAGNLIMTDSLIQNNTISKANFQYYYGAIYNSGSFIAYSNVFRNNSGTFEDPSRGSPTIYSVGTLNLTYNVFIENMAFSGISKDVYINSGEIISLDNNWWGSNDNPCLSSCVNIQDSVKSWLVLNVTPMYSPLNMGDSVDISTVWALSNNLSPDYDLIPIINISIDDLTFKFSKNLIYTYSKTQNKGLYNLTVDLYGFKQIVEVDVGKEKSDIGVTFSDNLSYLDDLAINVSVKSRNVLINEGSLIIGIAGMNYNIPVENGYANYTISGLNPGSYDLKVTYNGSSNYFKAFNTSKIIINKRLVHMSVDISDVFIDEKANAIVGLEPQGSQSQATLYIDGVKKKIVYLYAGETKISLNNFASGKYNITFEYGENAYFKGGNVSATLNVKKYGAKLNITANDIKVGDDATVSIKVDPADLRGEAILNVNGVDFAIFLENETTDVTLSNLKAGQYNIKVIYPGDHKYNPVNASSTLNVLKTSTKLTVDVKYDDNTLKGTVKVKTNTTKCSGLVYVYINYNVYKLNLSGGAANFNVKYDKGTNYIYVLYAGDDLYASSSWNTTIGVADEFVFIGEDTKGYEHNDFNYSVRLIEINGVPLPQRTVTIDFEGRSYDVKTDDGGYAYLNLNLKPGNYTIKATYKNQTITNVLTVRAIEFNLTSSNITYGEDEMVQAIFEENVSGKFNFTIKSTSKVADIINGKAVLNLSFLNAGDYEVRGFYLNDYFTSNPKTSYFNVKKADAKLDLCISNIISGEDADISVTTSKNATGEVKFILDGETFTSNIINSISSISVKNISGASHSIQIIYDGDDNYNSNSLNTSFYIKDLRSSLILYVENITYGESLNIVAIVDENATGNVSFNINGTVKTVDIENSRAVLSLNYLNSGNYTLKATYNGNDYYISSSNSTDFTIYKANSTISISCNAYPDENVKIYAYLSPKATGYVSFSMTDYYTSRNKEISDAIALWYISPLSYGIYTVRAKYLGDDNYNPSNTTYLINISQNKAKLTVELPDVTVNERVVVKVGLTADGNPLTDKVSVTFNSRTYTVDVRNGTGSLVVGKLSIGKYDWQATYGGSDVLTPATASGSFNVAEVLQVALTSRNVTKYYSGDERLEVSLKDLSANPISNQIIKIRLNSKQYNLTTDGEGKVYLELNLKSGEYLAEIIYDGSEKYCRSSLNVSVNVKSTVEGIDVVKIYKSGTQYFAIFLDANGKALSNSKVTFKIGSNSYVASTLPNGISRLNINLKPGKYSIVAINPQTGEKATNSLFIFNKLMENKDLTQLYTAGKYYKVRAYADNGVPVGGGKIVTFKINGKTYNVKTNSNGYASLKINLKPGIYTITASYGGVSVKNKVVVKSILKANNLNVKKSSKKIKIKISLKKVNGKYLKNKVVTLKFNKKTFKVKTNSKGVATFTIKNSAYKKLKTGKKYSYKVIYGKDTIKKTIKFKK